MAQSFIADVEAGLHEEDVGLFERDVLRFSAGFETGDGYSVLADQVVMLFWGAAPSEVVE